MTHDLEHYREWVSENLLMRAEAAKVTGQSLEGFAQSVKTGHIKPFVEYGVARKTRLYLRADLEEYAQKKRPARGY